MPRRPPRSTHCISSAASDVYKRQLHDCVNDLHHLIDLLETQDKEGVRQWLIAAQSARETVRQEEN